MLGDLTTHPLHFEIGSVTWGLSRPKDDE